MNASAEFESQSSVKAGVYRQNALYIRMDSLYDLNPAYGEPPEVAVPMFAHEYVHFLHNTSTTAGHAYLFANLLLITALGSGCDVNGYFLGSASMDEGQLELLKYSALFMYAQLGSTAAPMLASCKNIQNWTCGAPLIHKNDDTSTIKTDFKALDSDGILKNQTVSIGLSFITEGIAYLVDREMRRSGGMPVHELDAQTNIFPYLAYRVLIQSWSGRNLTDLECISIGLCALTHTLPGYFLTEICSALKNNQRPLDEVLTGFRDAGVSEANFILSKLRELSSKLSPGGRISIAMGEYMKLVEGGVRLRQKNCIPEFDLFSNTYTPETIKSFVGSKLDCLIIQGKPDGGVEMYWLGPGLIAQNDESSASLGVFQAAMHYCQLHITADGNVVKIKDLRGSVSCPFAGGCEAERNAGYPSACKSAPWERSSESTDEQQVCWYVAGVKAMGYNARMANTESVEDNRPKIHPCGC